MTQNEMVDKITVVIAEEFEKFLKEKEIINKEELLLIKSKMLYEMHEKLNKDKTLISFIVSNKETEKTYIKLVELFVKVSLGNKEETDNLLDLSLTVLDNYTKWKHNKLVNELN